MLSHTDHIPVFRRGYERERERCEWTRIRMWNVSWLLHLVLLLAGWLAQSCHTKTFAHHWKIYLIKWYIRSLCFGHWAIAWAVSTHTLHEWNNSKCREYLSTHTQISYIHSSFRLASHEYCLWYMIWFHGGCTKDAVRITYTTTTITHILQPFFETNVFSLAFSLVIGRENSWFSTIFFVWLIKIMVILGDFSKNGKSPLNWRSARCKTINFRPNKKLSIFSFAARCNCWFWFWSVVWNENVFVSFLVLFPGELLPFFSRVVSL